MENNSFIKKDFGLKYCSSKSEVKSGDFNESMISDLSKDFNNTLYIAYMYDGITIGKFDDGKFICSKGDLNFDWTQLLQLRIFNKDSELHIFKTSLGLKYRLRTDDVDTVENLTEYIEAEQVLFGTITNKKDLTDGYTKLTEDRGTEIILPFDFNIDNGAAQDKRVKIKTRNYFDYIDNHASYMDTRFVEFVLPEPEKEGK